MSYDLDYLNRRYEKLGKEIKAYQTEQNDIRQAIKRIGQETTEKHAITQAFLEKHPNVVYKDDHGPRFTIDCDETIRLSSTTHGVRYYTKIKDGVTITCNDRLPRPAYRPDDGWGLVDDQHGNLLCFDFELEKSYDLSSNLEKLPQILDNLAERVASVRYEVVNPHS